MVRGDRAARVVRGLSAFGLILVSLLGPAGRAGSDEIDYHGSITFSVSGGASGSYTWQGTGNHDPAVPDETSIFFRDSVDDRQTLALDKFADTPWGVNLYLIDASGTDMTWQNYGDENLAKCTVTVTTSDTTMSGSVECHDMPRSVSGAAGPPIDLSGSFNLSAAAPTTPIETPSPSPSPSPSNACTAIDGRIIDREGVPLRGMHVQLEADGSVTTEEATGTDGNYHLELPNPPSSSIRIIFLAQEWAHSPSHYAVNLGYDVIGLATPVFDPAVDGCTRDVSMSNLDPSMTTIPSGAKIDVANAFDAYRYLDDSWTLAARLGPEPDRRLPLQVFLWCEQARRPLGVDCPGKSGAHFDTFALGHPYIALNPANSSSAVQDLTFTMEHEFGHFFMWSAFGGAIPLAPGRRPHAGYYVNASSSDSWIEGFASFYALMVQRQVSGDPDTRILASFGDMESNAPPWLNAGKWEEFSVTGTLLDLADGPSPAGTGLPRRVEGSEIRVSEDGTIFAATLPPDTIVGAPWRAELLTRSGRRLTTIGGGVVAFDGKLVALGKLPGVPFDHIRLILHPFDAANDDDPIQGDLFTMWPAILSYQSSEPGAATGNGHLYDVSDLYQMASGLYAGGAAGQAGVDQVFTSHGFFGDTRGGVSNQKYDTDEIPGLTSHTERTEGDTTYPAMVPRTSPPELPELEATIDTGGVDATALVQIDEPDRDGGYAELIEPNADGRYALPIPVPGSGRTMSVIMLAPGYQAAPALEVDPKTFWPQAEQHPGQSFLSASVDMREGSLIPDTTQGSSTSGGGGGLSPVVFFMILAVVGVGVALTVQQSQRRRRRPAAAPAPITASTWTPTHGVVAEGALAWTTPDAATAPVATLNPGTSVRVIEERGGWAHVDAENGWSGWIEDRSLVPLR